MYTVIHRQKGLPTLSTTKNTMYACHGHAITTTGTATVFCHPRHTTISLPQSNHPRPCLAPLLPHCCFSHFVKAKTNPWAADRLRSCSLRTIVAYRGQSASVSVHVAAQRVRICAQGCGCTRVDRVDVWCTYGHHTCAQVCGCSWAQA